MKVGRTKSASDLASDLDPQKVGSWDRAEIGLRLAHIRASASQRDWASALDVPLRTYQNYERGERDPDLRVLKALFDRGWNINWLLSGIGNERLESLETSTFDASHDLSEEHLSIAMQLADKKIQAERRNPSYDQYARFVALIYEGITKGLPEADIFDIRPGERKPVRRQKDDDSEDGVGSKG